MIDFIFHSVIGATFGFIAWALVVLVSGTLPPAHPAWWALAGSGLWLFANRAQLK